VCPAGTQQHHCHFCVSEHDGSWRGEAGGGGRGNSLNPPCKWHPLVAAIQPEEWSAGDSGLLCSSSRVVELWVRRDVVRICQMVGRVGGLAATHRCSLQLAHSSSPDNVT